ncbi:MAG: hypothetical protein IKS34_03340 [Clostridia bacterium]|nr:hypothetical protein [Clostridia bacterium]
MKRIITVFVVCLLLTSLLLGTALTASAKKSKDEYSYFTMTLSKDLIGQDKYVCWVIPWDEIFEDGKQYTFYATVKFGDDCVQNGGCVYVNMYAYDNMEAAMTTDFNHLVTFIDFAKWPTDHTGAPTAVNEWIDFQYTCDPSHGTYGSFSGQTANLEAVWISIGYYLAAGTVSVREVGVKDDQGNIIYSQTFENGIDFEEPYFRHTDDIVPETEGEEWAIMTEKKADVEPSVDESTEPSEEPSADVSVESSEEPSEEPSADVSVEPSEEPSADVSVEPSEEPSEAVSEPAGESQAPVESQAPADSRPEESKPVETPSAGFPWWGWLLIGLGACAVVAVVLVLVLKSKKK